MKELTQIVKLWKAASERREPVVLATVVKTQGSSYRVPGARLLLTKSGERAGSISGGCLEDELIKKAWWLTEAGPAIRIYDTHSDEGAESGYGLGCNGTIDVLLERPIPAEAGVLEVIEESMAAREPAVIMHLVGPTAFVGEHLTFRRDERVSDRPVTIDLKTSAALSDQARNTFEEGSSRHFNVDGIEIFAEYVRPPVRLLICGAGDDAIPLADLATYLGWDVSIFDGRAHYAVPEKFASNTHVLAGSVTESIERLSLDPWTVAVLMTHSYSQDLQALKALVGRGPRYLGILGPRKRAEQLISDARLDSIGLYDSVHSPIGLDIGADGPEQVALAIVAEIQTVLNGRSGGLLRHRKGPIHNRQGAPAMDDVWTGSIVCR